MKKIIWLFLLFLLAQSAPAQSLSKSAAPALTTSNVSRPKLVVGIVVDQMRWDYLYRFYPLFKNDGGFKRFLNNGFSCENTFIPYTPTVTAAGHTCVYTGSVPAIHGIMGNEWYDRLQHTTMYCSEDNSVNSVGSNDEVGKMSPRNLLTTTIGDELKLATNFKSKVIGVAIKDRGAILPAGHAADAAYWYNNKTGDFITSTYYMQQLPQWMQAFNSRKIVDSLYKLNWNTLLPKETYLQYSTADEVPYENKPLGSEQKAFPYNLAAFAGKDYGKIASTPYGNSLTAAIAEAAVIGERLGKSAQTDFLTVSFSSPDYIGHSFGPNSWEQMDDYVRLDAVLGNFFNFLDAQVGKGNYTVFLTADHAVAHVPNFSVEHKLPGGAFKGAAIMNSLKALLKDKYNTDKLIIAEENYQLYLDNNLIDSAHFNKKEISDFIVSYLLKQDGITNAFALDNLMTIPLNSKQQDMFANGFMPTRSGDIQFVLKPGYVSGNGNGTSHGLWNPYDSHIPLLWYGWGIAKGKTNRETYMTDIAATTAALLHIQMPSGCVGKVIEEVMK
ncbi:alkaline phosphatase family protein [Ilyomonas limi]|uniref:Alkaline phosphatase family protein n=1 Tax=Ilyomonas limi TaxID=2575867 RepID=A0A4V5UV14_9BACT|nr:alkaline phosphatase PafA [Ilyomonas limi]TKK69783.1 alkaline phosphatase family protein [Ilyomonas limi]